MNAVSAGPPRIKIGTKNVSLWASVVAQSSSATIHWNAQCAIRTQSPSLLEWPLVKTVNNVRSTAQTHWVTGWKILIHKPMCTLVLCTLRMRRTRYGCMIHLNYFLSGKKQEASRSQSISCYYLEATTHLPLRGCAIGERGKKKIRNELNWGDRRA